MNLDVGVAVLTGLMALCAFSLDVLSSKKHWVWLNLPQFIRWEIRVTGALLTVRSVNLFTLAAETHRPVSMIGHANLEAMAVSLAMTATVISLTVYTLSLRLPARAWDRLGETFKAMRRGDHVVPLMVDESELVDIAHASGLPATAPGEGPSSVVREARRGHRLQRREPTVR